MSRTPSTVAFSHFGFFVKDLEKMHAFYTRVLGFVETDRGVARGSRIIFLSRDPREHHQIVLVEGRTGDLEDRVINQISLRVGSLAELKSRYRLVKHEAEVRDINPTDHGNAWSLYFRDPEGNRIELFVDSPWYVEQPRVDPLDLEASEEAIAARTYDAIKDHPSFRPYDEWRAEFAETLQKKMELAGAR
jgi:catechol-2,3-dioxygenase